jgi:hypothetical protein
MIDNESNSVVRQIMGEYNAVPKVNEQAIIRLLQKDSTPAAIETAIMQAVRLADGERRQLMARSTVDGGAVVMTTTGNAKAEIGPDGSLRNL